MSELQVRTKNQIYVGGTLLTTKRSLAIDLGVIVTCALFAAYTVALGYAIGVGAFYSIRWLIRSSR